MGAQRRQGRRRAAPVRVRQPASARGSAAWQVTPSTSIHSPGSSLAGHLPVNIQTPAPSATQQEVVQDGLPVPRRYWSAAGIWLALAMAVLDGAIANVALPTIARELGASPASSVWIINAYQLTITMLLLPLAALGDRVGYKCIYIPGLALF